MDGVSRGPMRFVVWGPPRWLLLGSVTLISAGCSNGGDTAPAGADADADVTGGTTTTANVMSTVGASTSSSPANSSTTASTAAGGASATSGTSTTTANGGMAGESTTEGSGGSAGAGSSDGTGSGGGSGGTGGGGGGSGGTGGGGGSGGGTPDVCSFDISGTLSADIPTVGVVDWSTDLEGITAAKIEFSLDDPQAGELNVGSGGPISVSEPQALLLGLKPERSYTYRIVASAGDTDCVSPDQQLVTEEDPEAQTVTRTPGDTAPGSSGFIVTCLYGGDAAIIMDTDGDVVWAAAAPPQCSRVHMDWEGEYLWMLKANPTYGDSGQVRRVRMDGSDAEQISGLEWTHHDFAVLPGGTAAFLVWADSEDLSSDLVERGPDGALTAVVRLDDITFSSSLPLNGYHANALRYYASDDSYTVSDLALGGIVQLDREGQLQWQLRGACTGAPAAECASASVWGNHGHQRLENGNLLVFSATNGSGRAVGAPAPAYEFSFGEDGGALTATLEWEHVGQNTSMILGDAQRLPNGNTLVTYSTDGEILEISPTGELVQSLSLTGLVGYTTFRQSLYGPPQ